jgi:hypothetical protein
MRFATLEIEIKTQNATTTVAFFIAGDESQPLCGSLTPYTGHICV